MTPAPSSPPPSSPGGAGRADRAIALGVLAILLAALYGRLLLGWAPSGGDIVNQYLPYQQMIRDAVRQGELPLWNDLTFSGRPLMADIQVGVLYPPNWLHWFLPLPLSFALLLAGHAAWMIAGCWHLGRRWGLEPAAVALGTVLFVAAPFFTIKVSQGVVLFIYVGSWWPWLALAATRLAWRPSFGALAAATAAIAMSLLAGSPQLTFYGWIMMLAVGLALPAPRGDEDPAAAPPSWLHRALWLAAAFLLAIGLTAVQSFQTAYFVGNSFERGGGAAWDYVTNGSLEPRHLLLMLNPAYLGVGPSATEFFFAYPPDYGEVTNYLPLWAVAVLAPLGLGALGRGGHGFTSSLHRRLAWLALAAVVLGLLLALGRLSPLFHLFYGFIPGFDRFRVPARLMLFEQSGLGLLAAIGLHRILTGQARRAAVQILAVAASAIVLAALWILYALHRDLWDNLGNELVVRAGRVLDRRSYSAQSQHLLAITIRCSVLLAAGACVLWALAAGRRGAFLWAPALLATAELAALALPFQSTGDPFRSSVRVGRYEEQFYPRTPLVEALLREHRGGRVLWLDDTHFWVVDQNQPEIYPNRLAMHRLPESRGYDPVNARWIGEWMNLLTGRDAGENPAGFMHVLDIARPAWLSVMGVESVVSYEDLSGVPGLEPVARFLFPSAPDVLPSLIPRLPGLVIDPATGYPATRLTLWRNTRFLGEAFAAPMPRLTREREPAAARLLSAQLARDPAAAPESVIVIPDVLLASGTIPAPEVDASFTVRALEKGNHRRVFETDAPAPMLLAWAMSAWPGWSASLDGEPVPIAPMSGTFWAVPVPAGRHQVAFEYLPPPLIGGLWVSIGAAVVMLYGLIRGLILRRKGRGA